jgi:hypothetical protein
MYAALEEAPSEEASRGGKDTPNIKDTYLSMDGIPSTITIHERSDGIPPTIVQFTSGHHFGDKSALATQNFAWDRVMKTHLRIYAQDTSLTSLLKTYAISPQYIMPDNDADELKGHCLITPRCFLNHGVFSDISSALYKSGFKWSRERRAWIKKITLGGFRKNIMNSFKKAPQRVSHQGTDQTQDSKMYGKHGVMWGTPKVKNPEVLPDASKKVEVVLLDDDTCTAKQDIKKVLKEQRNYEIQCDYQDMKFEQERNYFMYRLHKADSNPDYQRASYIYGQHIKRLAEQGIYDYPDPPKLPRYR